LPLIIKSVLTVEAEQTNRASRMGLIPFIIRGKNRPKIRAMLMPRLIKALIPFFLPTSTMAAAKNRIMK